MQEAQRVLPPLPPESGCPGPRPASLQHLLNTRLCPGVHRQTGASPLLGSTKIPKKTPRRIFSYILGWSRGGATLGTVVGQDLNLGVGTQESALGLAGKDVFPADRR